MFLFFSFFSSKKSGKRNYLVSSHNGGVIPIPVFIEAKELVSQEMNVADTSLVGDERGG